MPTTGHSRRRLLSFLTQTLLALLGLCLAIPALAYVWAPLTRKRGTENAEATFLDVGSLAELPVGEWRLLTVDEVRQDGWEKTHVRRAVWVRRQGEPEEAVTVFSPICPHLGCPINWHPAQSQFACPCHGGTFDAAGRLTGGPPPRGMDPLEYEVRDGRLRVRWQDFKIGVAQRVPVGS